MRLKNVSTTILVAVAALAVITSAFPSATAQTAAQQSSTQVVLQPFTAAIRPLSGIGVTTGVVTYTATFVYNANLLGVTLKLKVSEAPPWAVVTVSPATIVIPVSDGSTNVQPQQSISKQAPFKVIVATTADAPAFTPANIKITATADKAGEIPSSSGDDSTPVTADFFSIIDARTDQPIQQARPQAQILYPITVNNLGNADTKIQFTVTQADQDLTIVPPAPLTLQARQNGGKLTQQTVNLQIQAPYHNGYLNKVGAATVKIDSYYALDSKQKGDASQITILTTTKGFYVPGPGVLGLLVGLLGVALVVRRRSGSA